MAKEKEPKYDRGGKIRVVVFELEGSNETLQESLRTVANALGKTVSPNRTFTAIQDSQKVNLLPEPSDDSDSDIDISFETEDTTIEVTAKPRRTSGKRKPARTPEIVDMNLKAGQITFEDFANQKNPSSDIARYLVIMYWLRENLKINEITTDHAYTCYRHMRWKTPVDPGNPLRNAKTSNYVNSGSSKGYYTLNHIGETQIDRMTGS